MKLFTILSVLLFSDNASFAQVKSTLIVDSSSKVYLTGILKHRHSFDCYTFKKGDEYVDFGSKSIVIEGKKAEVIDSGRAVIGSEISSPFSVNVRQLVLNVDSSVNTNGADIKVDVKDVFSSVLGQIHSEKCRHTDGFSKVVDAETSVGLVIDYKVPANTWLLNLNIVNARGALSLRNLKAIEGTHNLIKSEKYSENLRLWVKPNTTLKFVFTSEKMVFGEDIGGVNLKIETVGQKIDEVQIKEVLKKLVKDSETLISNKKEILDSLMGIANNPNRTQELVRGMNLADLKAASDSLLSISNGVYPGRVDGHDIKTAAALAAYTLSQIVLQEAGQFCRDINIYLPYTEQTQRVSGLRAISFWLSRSVNYMNSYSYTPIRSLIEELNRLQESGLRPVDISNNDELKKRIQESFKLVVAAQKMGDNPFNRASVDFRRIAKAFPDSQIFGDSKDDLFQSLVSADQKSQKMMSLFSELIFQMNGNNTSLINYQPFLNELTEVERLQKQLSEKIAATIRILSVNSVNSADQLVTNIFDLLNNQNYLFQKRTDIPYFDSIAAAFSESIKNESKIKQVDLTCMGVSR